MSWAWPRLAVERRWPSLCPFFKYEFTGLLVFLTINYTLEDALQDLATDPFGIFALVLTPTRELALQISDQFRLVGRHINLRLVTVVGGRDMVAQGAELAAKPHIVVATPGR
jgi:superfamily II DNA/RNA helicase